MEQVEDSVQSYVLFAFFVAVDIEIKFDFSAKCSERQQ